MEHEKDIGKALSMALSKALFYNELKCESNYNYIYKIRSLFHCIMKFERHSQNAKFLNAIIASNIATQEVFASVK